jgi:hypothetical protein
MLSGACCGRNPCTNGELPEVRQNNIYRNPDFTPEKTHCQHYKD